MRNIFFSIIAIFSFVQVSLSQGTYLGIKIGYNESALKSEEPSGSILEERKSPGFALVYSYPFADNFGITLEPGWMKKGSEIASDTLDYQFHYLNMPVMLDFYPIKKIKISLGPEIGYLANATNRINDTTTFNLLSTYSSRWEFSGVASLSYSVSFYSDLGIRYSRSFAKIASYDPILDRRNLYTEYIQAFILLKILN